MVIRRWSMNADCAERSAFAALSAPHGHAHPGTGTVRQLAAAAQSLDCGAMRDIVVTSIARHGVLLSWERLINPVCSLLRAPTGDPDASAVPELIFTRCVLGVLALLRRPRSVASAPVVLACADEEHETLPLEVLAASLGEYGVTCCVLGARVPPRALIDATGRLRPKVAVIWSQVADRADPALVAQVSEARRGTTVIAAGPGWRAGILPPGVTQPADVGTAALLTMALLRHHRRVRRA